MQRPVHPDYPKSYSGWPAIWIVLGKKLQNVLGKSPVLGNKIGFQIFEIVDQLGENRGNFMYLFPENMIFGHRILANIWYWDVLEFEKMLAFSLLSIKSLL